MLKLTESLAEVEVQEAPNHQVDDHIPRDDAHGTHEPLLRSRAHAEPNVGGDDDRRPQRNRPSYPRRSTGDGGAALPA